MKPGLSVGRETQLEVTVTPDLFPAFQGNVIHPVLSTVAMVHYMEWVGRLVILPYLTTSEEGIGGGIDVKHLAPAPEGSVVQFFAKATYVDENKVICRVWAAHKLAQVGEGTLTQFILPKTDIQSRIQAMRQH